MDNKSRRKCCVPECAGKNGAGSRKLFKFPVEEGRRAKWLERLGLPTNYGYGAVVCELHFNSGDVLKKRLSCGAVPIAVEHEDGSDLRPELKQALAEALMEMEPQEDPELNAAADLMQQELAASTDDDRTSRAQQEVEEEHLLQLRGTFLRTTANNVRPLFPNKSTIHENISRL